jgi:hypothetical protein
MKRQASIMLAAGLLMAGIPAATAAVQSPSGSAKMSQPLSGTLSLTTTQRTRAWNDLQKQAREQKAPSNFKPIVGSAAPSAIKIEPVPSKAASDLLSLKSYDYAMTQGKLLVVNPSDKKIAAVLSDTTGT